ncbi:type III secretion system chaperone [Roseovarius sp. EL26]|uniref:type III secretion system chaperone n=1 Tax=Roseovarius sp. EL26 TaxID=2126672 RepID=UPI000EA17C8F|nr:type III secretion system chaperone [Roseovarius sp. EL26]
MKRLFAAATLALLPVIAMAQEPVPDTPTPDTNTEVDPQAAPVEPAMTLERMNQIITTLDPGAQTNGKLWQLTIAETELLIVTDPDSDRMRILSPIQNADEVSSDKLNRMMQANFDTALDARYALAKGTLWSTYIHPLSPLEKDQLISGIGQVVNLVKTYGTLYSGGALQYGGGDSAPLQRQLIDDLLKKGEEI